MEFKNDFLINKLAIDKEDLDKNQYTFSLLLAGIRHGLVNKEILESIQTQIMLILKELIIRYTKGESTSVTVNTAERILNSIIYCIDAFIESYCDPGEAITILKTKNIKEIYDKGVEVVSLFVDETKELFSQIMKNKLDVPMEAYNSTIDEGIPDFFRKYEIVFSAHDTMASIDYPLLFDDMSIRGIFYIKQYLEKLQIETEFCNFFRSEDIIITLNNYSRIYGINYTEALINIFEVLINNSIFSVISGNNAGRLAISKSQYEFIERKIPGLNSAEISCLIDETVNKLIDDLNISSVKLIDYFKKYKVLLIQRILSAKGNRSLNNLIVIDNNEKPNCSGIAFEDGGRISDARYRELISKIVKCQRTKDKIDIIKNNIHSMQDFTDILDGDCLFGDEFKQAYNILGDSELAILGRAVFYEEPRSGHLALSFSIANKETESEWQTQYIRFIGKLSKERLEIIEKLVNSF